MRIPLALLFCIGMTASAAGEEMDFALTKAGLEEDRVELIAVASALLKATPEVAHEYVFMLQRLEHKVNGRVQNLRGGRLTRVWAERANRLRAEEVRWACLTWWASQIRATAMDFKRAATLYASSANAEYLKSNAPSLRQIEPGSIYLPNCE